MPLVYGLKFATMESLDDLDALKKAVTFKLENLARHIQEPKLANSTIGVNFEIENII